MEPHEELREQREAITVGTWVQRRVPGEPGEGCSAFRVVGQLLGVPEGRVNGAVHDGEQRLIGFELVLGSRAVRALAWAIAEEWPLVVACGDIPHDCGLLIAIQNWNDADARTFADVVDALFRGEIVAKECEHEAA